MSVIVQYNGNIVNVVGLTNYIDGDYMMHLDFLTNVETKMEGWMRG